MSIFEITLIIWCIEISTCASSVRAFLFCTYRDVFTWGSRFQGESWIKIITFERKRGRRKRGRRKRRSGRRRRGRRRRMRTRKGRRRKRRRRRKNIYKSIYDESDLIHHVNITQDQFALTFHSQLPAMYTTQATLWGTGQYTVTSPSLIHRVGRNT